MREGAVRGRGAHGDGGHLHAPPRALLLLLEAALLGRWLEVGRLLPIRVGHERHEPAGFSAARRLHLRTLAARTCLR